MPTKQFPLQQSIDDYLSILGDAPCDCPAAEMILLGHVIFRRYCLQNACWRDEIDRGEKEYTLADGEAWYDRFTEWGRATEKWLAKAEDIDKYCDTHEIAADVKQLREEVERVQTTLVHPQEPLDWVEKMIAKGYCLGDRNISLYDAIYSD